jgi:hypothetical protein
MTPQDVPGPLTFPAWLRRALCAEGSAAAEPATPERPAQADRYAAPMRKAA